ncbi:hypothetical protein WJX75_004592 [Coccomyxa subellipsoidea]|uniref:WASH1 WAHD domain-containing protein n=1 Tax=Coccomyxa subellipsoidea TaxID=248742 RepID=A0ABR2YY26_9CHLO
MVCPEFIVPLTPQDLPPEETYEMINASLAALQQATDGVFTRIQNAVEDRRGRLEELLERLERIELKIGTLSKSNHPLAAQASALYPEIDALRDWHPLFPSKGSLGTHQKNSFGEVVPPPPQLPADDGGRVKGQDTAELLHFFKQAQATSSAITTQGGPTSIPENLTSATSLLRYGGNRAAFGAADMDSAADLMPAVSSSITMQKAQKSRRVVDLDRPSPPQPFSFQELPFPALSLPRTLPDLEASSQRSTSARSGNSRPESSRPRVPWDPAFTGRQLSQETRSSQAASEAGEPSGKAQGRASGSTKTPSEDRAGGQAPSGQATSGQATSRQQAAGQKRPPRSLPPSRGGSAEALDAQASGPPSLRMGGPLHFLEDPGSAGSQRRFAHIGDISSALDKHMDLGALGGVPSDLEHSIILRQRSLTSRASFEDAPH